MVKEKVRGNLIVISGPSGCGKGTICSKLLKNNPELFLNVSMTTREPRLGEVDGVDYYFVTKDEFLNKIDNFDMSYNVQFSTYAVPMILGEIKRYIRDNNSIRISRSIKDLSYKISCYVDSYYQENGKEPNYSDVAKKLGVSEYEVGNAIIAMKDQISMYEPIYNDGGDTIYLYDQIVDNSSINNFSNKLVVDNAIMDLSEREKYILDQRYIVGKTQMEVADVLDISQAQVSRLEKKAIKELKKVLK